VNVTQKKKKEEEEEKTPKRKQRAGRSIERYDNKKKVQPKKKKDAAAEHWRFRRKVYSRETFRYPWSFHAHTTPTAPKGAEENTEDEREG
jgi:hypothetical protein